MRTLIALTLLALFAAPRGDEAVRTTSDTVTEVQVFREEKNEKGGWHSLRAHLSFRVPHPCGACKGAMALLEFILTAVEGTR